MVSVNLYLGVDMPYTAKNPRIHSFIYLDKHKQWEPLRSKLYQMSV